MKRIFLFCFFILAFCTLHAQRHYQFRTDAPQGFSIISSNASGLSLHYAIKDMGIADIDNGKEKGQEIMLKGHFASNAEGMPNLPFENQYIAVPMNAQVRVDVKVNAKQTFNDINLLPAAPLQENTEEGLPKLRKDMSIFSMDAPFPSESVNITQTSKIRGLDVAILHVTPFQYNPVRKTLEVLYDMDITIQFEDGNGQFGEIKYRNPAWDNILRDLVINDDMLPEAHYYDFLNKAIQDKEEGCEYLIISPDDQAILSWADTLKEYRTRQGILTKVVTVSDCGGNDPQSIRNYVLNAYENWAIPPAALLLFSDYDESTGEGIKPYFYSMISWQGYYYRYPSDNPFADMNGDSIPDLAVSRLTAFTPDEYEFQIKKLMQYELNPPTDPHYYDHPIISSGYQDNTWFMITSQIANGYYTDKLHKHPTNLYMVFDQSEPNPTPPESEWSIAYNTNAAVDYFGPSGTHYIPESIGDLDNWQSMNDNSILVDAFQSGSFLTLFRDHSDAFTWACPWFGTGDILDLTCTTPTYLISIGCLTGNFSEHYLSDIYKDCFITCFNKRDAGSLGGIGATSGTYTLHNDLISWGFLDHIWPDFMPTLGTQTAPDFVQPAYCLAAAKLFLRQQAFVSYEYSPSQVDKTNNLFVHLGETYLNLYTEQPQPLSMEVPLYHVNNQWQFQFTAEEGATVCISKGDEILQVLKGTGQVQSITLPPMEVGEHFTLTATKQNCLRYQSNTLVIPDEGSYIYVKKATFNDQNGNGQLDYSEHATFDLELCNAGHNSGNGKLTLTCDSPYITLLENTINLPRLETDNILLLDHVFKIRVADDIPDQTSIRFELSFQDGDYTHQQILHTIANAPLVIIDPEFSPITEEGEPSTHITPKGKSFLTFYLQNAGHASTRHISTDLDIKAPFVNVAAPILHEEELLPDERIPVTFELNTQADEIKGAWLQSQLHVQYGKYQTVFDTIIPLGGLTEDFETDTLNEIFKWTNSGFHPWEYCEEDAYEGHRCLVSTALTNEPSILKAIMRSQYCPFPCKVSFHYKTDPLEDLYFYTQGLYDDAQPFSHSEWQYGELICHKPRFYWYFITSDIDHLQAKLDDICFPPALTTIGHAGNDLVLCDGEPVEILDAYAYDCDSVLWVTSGDGHFEYDTITNPVYYPGIQDLANKNVTLTLFTYGNDTIVSSKQIQFIDPFETGSIIGDSLVNLLVHQTTHYQIDHPMGTGYHWTLEPTEAGCIYGRGNAIEIVWNDNESFPEAVLSLAIDHGCASEPLSKHIQLIHNDPEWLGVDFDLFPNPAKGTVNLYVKTNIKNQIVMEVFNITGMRLMTQQFNNLFKGECIPLQINSLAPGVYFIKLDTGDGSKTKKLCIK